MPLSQNDAPYSGGFLPGGRIFAVDGDFSIDSPDGPPEFSFPQASDSMISVSDVVLKHVDGTASLGFKYVAYPLGNKNNFQPWHASQSAFVIDQQFKVAMDFYKPWNLNTRYDPAWALPWIGNTPSGVPLPDLSAAILVREGPVKNVGGGIVEIERRFATIPGTWNEAEQFCLKRVSFGIRGLTYLRDPVVIMSRIQRDYFVYDQLNILADIPLFTDPTANGIRLNASTGFRPQGIILEAMKVYGISDRIESDAVFDADAAYGIESADKFESTPSLTQWESWMTNGNGTSNGLPAEMVIESSTFSRYMGNILERRTRFAEVQ